MLLPKGAIRRCCVAALLRMGGAQVQGSLESLAETSGGTIGLRCGVSHGNRLCVTGCDRLRVSELRFSPYAPAVLSAAT